MQIVNKPINIMTFDEIGSVTDIDDLFKKYDKHYTNSLLILYRTSGDYGHWTALNKLSKDRYDFFDSYGEPIDSQRLMIEEPFRTQSEQFFPHILSLIDDRKKFPNVHYNSIRLQDLNPNHTTCGRYCALFMKYRMPVEEFVDVIKKYSKKISPDQLVTGATAIFLGR